MIDDLDTRLSAIWEAANASGRRVPVFLALNPRLLARAIQYIRRLPRLTAVLTDGVDGRLILESLRRICLVRLFRLSDTGVCLLPIPGEPKTYSLGASKQTLRRKVRAAEKAGITCRAVEDEAEQARLVDRLDRAFATKSNPNYRDDRTCHLRLIGRRMWTVAYSRSGEPLVVAVTPCDGDWALLWVFVSLGESPEHSDARYLLTQAVVERLSEAGAKFLVDTRSPAELPNGLRHFQRMLGFRMARIELQSAGSH